MPREKEKNFSTFWAITADLGNRLPDFYVLYKSMKTRIL